MKLSVEALKRFVLCGGGYPVLIALAALMDVRRTLAFALLAREHDGQAIFDGIEYMLVAEWLVILAATQRVDWTQIKAGALERAFGLLVAAGGLFAVVSISHWFTMVVCLGLAARLSVEPSARRVSAALVVVASQYVLVGSAFQPLHDYFARIDAWATHHFLAAAGFANDLSDNIVQLQESAFGIVINPGCSTTSILPGVGAAFLIFALCWRASARGIVLGLFVASGACVVLNLFRLSLMAMSPDDYHFWHGGDGKSLVGLAMTAIAYLTAAAVIRRDGLRQEAPAHLVGST